MFPRMPTDVGMCSAESRPGTMSEGWLRSAAMRLSCKRFGLLLHPSRAAGSAVRGSKKVSLVQVLGQSEGGSSESRITGQGFNAVKFDPRKPARMIRRNDGNLGMHGA